MMTPMIRAAMIATLLAVPGLVQADEAWPPERLSGLFDGSANASAGPAVSVAGGAARGGVPLATPVAKPMEVEEAKAVSEAVSQPPIEEIPGSDWRAVGRLEDAVLPGNPSAPEKEAFWDKLRNQSFWNDATDTLCKQAQIPVSQSLRLGGVAVIHPEFKRFLRTGLDGRQVLVDQARLKLGLGYSPLQAGFGGGTGLSLNVGSELDGMSMVVRPLKSKRACSEIDELIDLRTVKTVLPMDADRFSAMQVGEIWTIPLAFRAYVGVGAGAAVAGVPLSVSWGYSRSGGTSVSLRRLDPDTLRVRVRLDYARVHGPSGGIVYSILSTDFEQFRVDGKEAAGDFLGELAGEGLAWKLLDREIRRQFERYFRAQLTWMAQWTKDDHALIEVLLDPNDKTQMKVLEKLLAGGDIDVLDTLVKMSRSSGKMFLHLDDMRDKMDELKKSYEAAFSAAGRDIPVFAATDRITGFITSLRLKIPLLFDYSTGWGKRDEKLTLFDDAGGEFDIYRSHWESSTGVLDLPFLGRVANYNQRRSVMAFTHVDAQGRALAPALVYVQQEGYTMQPEEMARGLALKADRLMRLVGTRGRGENPQAGLPLERVFPRKPRPNLPDSRPDFLRENTVVEPPTARYRRGMGAFTLVLGDKAIGDILSATPEEVVRCYVRAQDRDFNGAALQWVVDNGKFDAKGNVAYNPKDLEPFGSGDGMRGVGDSVRTGLSYARILAESLGRIRAMRPEGSLDPQAARVQAEALRDLLAGSVGYGLSYDELLNVLVQLVEPAQLSAEFVVTASASDKADGDVSGRYLFNRGLEEDETLKKLAESANRFNRSSPFTD